MRPRALREQVDKIDKDSYSMNEYTKSLRSKPRVRVASVVYTSALGAVPKVLATAAERHRKRLTTATLNAVVQADLWKSPQRRGGRKGKIYYATQASTRPPTLSFRQRSQALRGHPGGMERRCARTSVRDRRAYPMAR